MDDLVAKALHAARQHFDEGGFLDSLRGMFSGPDYQSTGEVASPTNWGDPESAADFFRADRALRLAREVQAKEPELAPLTAPRPGAVETRELPARQPIASPPPAPTQIPFAAPDRGVTMSGSGPATIASQPLAYTAAPTPAPAQAAITAAMPVGAKFENRIDPNAIDERAENVWSRMLRQESGNRQFDRNGNTITSPAGALGISQVMPSTGPEAARLAGLPWSLERLRNDPEYNHALGRAYYDAQVERFGDPTLAAAAYNGGPGRVASALRQARETGQPWTAFLKPETQHYVRVVGRAEGGEVDAPDAPEASDGVDQALDVVRQQPAEEPRPLTIYRDNRPKAADAGETNALGMTPEQFAEYTQTKAPPTPSFVEDALRNVREYAMPRAEDYTHAMDQSAAAADYLTKSGKEGMLSGNPWEMAKGAGKSMLGTALPVIAPVGAALEAGVVNPAERVLGPAGRQAAEIATMVPGEGASAAMKIARATGEAAPIVTAMSMIPKSVEAAAPARELSPLGFYSHGAETAAGLQQAKGSPEQMIANLRRSAVKPEELYNSGIADETATLAKRTMIESEYAPKVEAAKQAMEGLVPGTPEFKAAERQFKNISSSMRAEMDNAMVLHPDWASRPSVTREELAQHFQQRMPQVEETVLGTPSPEQMKGLRDEYARAEYGEDFSGLASEYKRRIDDLIMDRRSTTKFGKYTLPGGENYREVLLKLPDEFGPLRKEVAEAKSLRTQAVDDYAQAAPGSPEASEAQDRIIKYTRLHNGLIDKKTNMTDFRSSHWDDPNVLAHLRFSDRVGPNGEKILHMEEAQSDWGQKGRKEGFKNPSVEARQAEIENALNQLRQEKIDSGMALERKFKENTQEFNAEYKRLMQPAEDALNSSRGSTSDINAYNAASDKVMEQIKHLLEPHEKARDVAQHAIQKEFSAKMAPLQQEYSALPKIGSTSTAPYVTGTQAWTDLAIKRALKEAAEGGYDKLVWTPGAEQAKRYDLSKQISNLEYVPSDNHLKAYDTSGRQVMNQMGVPPEKISDYVGKDVAAKLLNDENAVKFNGETGFHRLSGLDLQTGGEGMNGYYDKIWPNQLGKQAKKLDPSAKVGITDVMLPQGLHGMMGHNNPPFAAPGLTITPKMRESILNGQTVFKDGGSVVDRALMLVSQQA